VCGLLWSLSVWLTIQWKCLLCSSIPLLAVNGIVTSIILFIIDDGWLWLTEIEMMQPINFKLWLTILCVAIILINDIFSIHCYSDDLCVFKCHSLFLKITWPYSVYFIVPVYWYILLVLVLTNDWYITLIFCSIWYVHTSINNVCSIIEIMMTIFKWWYLSTIVSVFSILFSIVSWLTVTVFYLTAIWLPVSFSDTCLQMK